MEVRFLWNGHEIQDGDEEFRAHIKELLTARFMPYAMAHIDRTAKAMTIVEIENGDP